MILILQLIPEYFKELYEITATNNAFTYLFLAVPLLSLAFAILIDFIIGDPELKYHPVMLIGKTLSWLERKITRKNPKSDKFKGVFMLIIVEILVFVIVLFLEVFWSWIWTWLWSWILYCVFNLFALKAANTTYAIVYLIIFSLGNGFILKWAFAIRNLYDVSRPIYDNLEKISNGQPQTEKGVKDNNRNYLAKARYWLSRIVRRDTSQLDEEHILSGTVEVIAESATDAALSVFFFYFAALYTLLIIVTFLLAIGFSVLPVVISDFACVISLMFIPVPFAYIFRVINTADSVVGYKTESLKNVGYFSAKSDDLANYFPARISAYLMIIMGSFMHLDYKNGLKALKKYQNSLESLNAGWTMSPIAGMLGVCLEKIGSYKIGEKKRELKPDDINTTFRVVKYVILVFVIICALIYLLFALLLLTNIY